MADFGIEKLGPARLVMVASLVPVLRGVGLTRSELDELAHEHGWNPTTLWLLVSVDLFYFGATHRTKGRWHWTPLGKAWVSAHGPAVHRK